jgi:hypothetical protein
VDVEGLGRLQSPRPALGPLGVRADVCEATLTWLRALAAGEPPPG